MKEKYRISEIKNMRRFSKDEATKIIDDIWIELDDRAIWPKKFHDNINELVEIYRNHNNNIETPDLDSWIIIFDEVLSWLTSHCSVIFKDEFEDDKEPELTEFKKSCMLLLSKITSDSFAIRKLILDGYDSSSQTILRSVSEYIDVLIMILNDPDLSIKFNKSNNTKEASIFYYSELKGSNAKNKVIDAWKNYYKSIPDFDLDQNEDYIKSLYDFISKNRQELQGLIHPSFKGSLSSLIGLYGEYNLEHERTNIYRCIFGNKKNSSSSIIQIYLLFIYPLVVLMEDFPFSGWDDISIIYDDENTNHFSIKYGRIVILELIYGLIMDNDDSLTDTPKAP